MNNFGLFFTRNRTVIRLPVNPETLPLEIPSTNQDYNVLGIGQIMQPRTPGLKTVKISSFFPGKTFPGVLTPNDFKGPEFYIGFFESAMKDKEPILYTPVRYYEDGTPYMTEDTGFSVLVNGFSYEERGGETGDFYYDLDLIEYRDFTPQKVVIKKTAETKQETQQAVKTPTRAVPPAEIVVGSRCALNGNYYYSSYGDTPYGSASGRTVLVQYIVDLSRAKPYHVTTEEGGALGWTDRASLQVMV